MIFWFKRFFILFVRIMNDTDDFLSRAWNLVNQAAAMNLRRPICDIEIEDHCHILELTNLEKMFLGSFFLVDPCVYHVRKCWKAKFHFSEVCVHQNKSTLVDLFLPEDNGNMFADEMSNIYVDLK